MQDIRRRRDRQKPCQYHSEGECWYGSTCLFSYGKTPPQPREQSNGDPPATAASYTTPPQGTSQMASIPEPKDKHSVCDHQPNTEKIRDDIAIDKGGSEFQIHILTQETSGRQRLSAILDNALEEKRARERYHKSRLKPVPREPSF